MATRIDATIAGADSNCYLSLADADAHFAGSMREDAWEDWPDDERERALIQATAQIERLRLRGSPSSIPQALHFPRAGDYDYDDEANVNDINDRAGDTLDLVSDDAGDTQVATMAGEDTDGRRISEDVNLTGTSAATSTKSFLRLRSITLASAAVGTITISETTGGAEVCTIDPGDTAPDTTWELLVPEKIRQACCEQALHLLDSGGEEGDGLIDHRAMQAAGVKSVSLDGVSVSYGGASAGAWSPSAWQLLQSYVSRVGRVKARGYV